MSSRSHSGSGRRRKRKGGVGAQWWEPTNADVYKDWFRLGAAERRDPAFSNNRGAQSTRKRSGGKAEKSFSGVDCFIKGLRKIGTMPPPEDRDQLPFDHVERHNFHRIPGYAGFCPGDKCKEKVNMMYDGSETERLSQLLSRNLSTSLGGGYLDAAMPRSVNDQIWAFKVNPEPLTQFSRVRTDVWPTVKDTITGQ